MFDLLIFDCDGTLVDSELLHNTASSQIITEMGFPQYTPAYCLEHFAGAGQARVWQTVEQAEGVKLPADINQRYIRRVIDLQDQFARQAPDVEILLEELQGRYQMCVGSNGEPENVLGLLNLTNLMRFFGEDHVYTASMVTRPKPEPDLFLYAASRYNSDPARTLVVEDSIAGATAGVRAGMTVFGYTGLIHDKEEHARKLKAIGVHHISDSWDDFRVVLNGQNTKVATH